MPKYLKLYFNATKWLPTKNEWLKLTKSLTKDESDGIHEYVFKSDCKFRLVSSLLMRYCIKSLMSINWNCIQIKRSEKGRPYCLNTKKIDFNTSHSGDYVIVSAVSAIESNLKIGSDVMKVENTNPRQYESFQRIKENVFTTNEISLIESRTGLAKQLLEFNRMWSLKESFVKAIGDGIGFELKRIDFKITNDLQTSATTNNTYVIVDGKKLENCNFFEEYINDHVMSVCLLSNSNNFLNKTEVKEFEELRFKEIFINDIIPEIGLNQSNMEDDGYWYSFSNKQEKHKFTYK